MLSFKIFSSLFLILVHLYLFYKLQAAFGKKFWISQIGIFFILVLACWLFRKSFYGTFFQTWMLPLSYTWLGFVLISLPWFLFSDLCHILCIFSDRTTGKKWSFYTSPPVSVPVVLIFSLCLAVYAFWSAAHPKVRFVDFPTVKLPENTERIRIVQLSDIHLGPTVRASFLEKVLRQVTRLQPDLFVITGDLVDSDMGNRRREAELLKNTKGKFGNFAVTGNHEVISGLNQSLDFMEKADLRILRGEKIEEAGIEIIGMDDPMVHRQSEANKTPNLGQILHGKKSEQFRLVLAHRPKISQECIGLFDLQLSGHTHNGQIWPGNLFVRYAFKDPAPGLSHYSGEKGESALYLSPGTGFWGPPMRLWARPEITVIDLVRP